MPCPKNGPCSPFATELDLCCLVTGAFEDPCINGTNQPVPPELIENALEAASEVLWTATGRQFGTCQVKIRPCGSGDGCNPCPDGGEIPFWSTSSGGWGFDWSGFPWVPSMDSNGVWTNTSCSCKDCCHICHIDLPYPVCSVDEVKVNGVTLGPESYRVDDFRQLVRLGALPQIVDDWSSLPLNTLSPIQVGDLLLGGPSISTQLFFPLLSETKVRTGAGVVQWTLGNQANDEPGSPCIEIQFDNPGDTATVDPALVVGVTGSATYDSNTGVITYTGQASPPRVEPELVKVCYLQSVKVSTITFDQSAWIYAVTWTDLHPDGEVGCWPECQNLLLPDSEPNTFSVTVTYGRPVPAIIRMATAALACEFIKACVGQPCLLPQRVQSISRQGVTVGFLDPMDFLAQGRTGIYLVDMAVSRYNPHSLLKTASVYSPDVGRRWRRADT